VSGAGPARVVLVVPCYDEERRLDVDALRRGVESLPGVDLLLVNDGSRDRTLERLADVRNGLEHRVEVLDLSPNAGKAEAVRRGFLHALQGSPDVIGYWDADLATPLREIRGMRAVFEARPEIEIVTGARINLLGRSILRTARRHYAGRVFATAVALVLDTGIYDTQCGAKLFRVVPGLRELFSEPFESRWIFDVEIFARRKLLPGRDGTATRLEDIVYEYPLDAWYDVAGSKLKTRDFVRAALELDRIRRRYRLRSLR
jgi:dolichyl-phosphate beta-glucosyltransferase